MKVSRFSDAQKAFILKQGADGMPVADICRKAGISQATYFNWKKKYDGLLPSEMRRLKQLEDENKQAAEGGGRSEPRQGDGSTVIFSDAVLAPPLAAPSATADRLRRAPSLNRPGARPCLPLACNPMPGLCGKARDR
jgi:putative transposase